MLPCGPWKKAVEETPPTVNRLRGTNTRTGEMKQHWVTDSRPRPVRQGDSYVSELNNDKQYASFVNDGTGWTATLCLAGHQSGLRAAGI